MSKGFNVEDDGNHVVYFNDMVNMRLLRIFLPKEVPDHAFTIYQVPSNVFNQCNVETKRFSEGFSGRN